MSYTDPEFAHVLELLRCSENRQFSFKFGGIVEDLTSSPYQVVTIVILGWMYKYPNICIIPRTPV